MKTCPAPPESPKTEALFQNVTFHKLAIGLSAIFTIFTCALSFFLIFKHAANYTKSHEQRYIIRIIFVLPVYSIIGLLSICFYDVAPYIKPIGDVYEAFALGFFFLLLLCFVIPDEMRKAAFFEELSFWRPGSKLIQGRGNRKGFHTIWIFVFQYPVTKTFITIVMEITLATGRYCETSNSPAFAHIWVQIIQTLGVGLCVSAILKFYQSMKAEMAAHKPLSKFLALKVIVFLNVVQTFIFSFLISGGHLKPSSKLSYKDLTTGIPSLLFSIEMVGFSIFFLFAYSYRPYLAGYSVEGGMKAKPAGPFFGSLLHAANFSDLVHAIAWAFHLALGFRTQNFRPDSEGAELNAMNTGDPYEEHSGRMPHEMYSQVPTPPEQQPYHQNPGLHTDYTSYDPHQDYSSYSPDRR